MSELAIWAEDLGKRYRLGGRDQSYGTLRESIMQGVRAPVTRTRISREDSENTNREFWALQKVSFEVRRGEVLGVIGRNGAGKSTLLKILSRITKPSTGRFSISTRTAGLLEVGTGFHRELTGRENVFLNGAILGMSRAEIARKFDEIIAFAEVERFVDTQVKFYSSGMSIRLAFAVAAHLEPDVLLIDEVLSVGDSRFQRRSLNKMEDARKEGKTVVFVSHNMPTVMRLCERILLLEAGSVIADGDARVVAGQYLSGSLGTTAHRIWSRDDAPGAKGVVRLRGVRVVAANGDTTASIDIRSPVGIELDFEVLTKGRVLIPNIQIFNEVGVPVSTIADQSPESKDAPRPVGRFRSTVWIPANFLAEGTMLVSARISSHSPDEHHLTEREAVAFQVVDSLDGDSARGHFAGYWGGVVRPLLEWTTEVVVSDDEIGAAETGMTADPRG
ncbi:MAG TPA: polysaccharide ABC transporter ATP-binding protein [Chloroflexota bacterium]|nr:polysaccharide ABC transporter ATP-binding protein [Chloroflexota bacterium]